MNRRQGQKSIPGLSLPFDSGIRLALQFYGNLLCPLDCDEEQSGKNRCLLTDVNIKRIQLGAVTLRQVARHLCY